MRNLLVFLVLLTICHVGFTQEVNTEKEDNVKTLFKKKSIKFTGLSVSPEIKSGYVNDDIGIFAGGKMGFTFNRNFQVGIGFFGLVKNPTLMAESVKEWSDQSEQLATLKFIYGGLALEYSIFNNKIIHFNIPVLVGPGKVSLKGEEDILIERVEQSTAFIVEPGLAIELNLYKFLKVDLGASYRYVSSTNLENLSDENLSDFSYNATLKFNISGK